MYTYTYTQTHTHTQIHTCTHTHTQTHTYTHKYTHVHIHIHTNTHTNAHMYTYTYTHVHTHTHTDCNYNRREVSCSSFCEQRSVIDKFKKYCQVIFRYNLPRRQLHVTLFFWLREYERLILDSLNFVTVICVLKFLKHSETKRSLFF